jgi:hypothetical protein
MDMLAAAASAREICLASFPYDDLNPNRDMIAAKMKTSILSENSASNIDGRAYGPELTGGVIC